MPELDKLVKVMQSWWHIEDEQEPSDGRMVYRVLDLYFDKYCFAQNNKFRIPLAQPFVGFKVRNKHNGQELSFIADFNTDQNENIVEILVNLGYSSQWPLVHGTNYLHIKIQYEYIETWPVFEKRANWPLGAKIRSELEDYTLVPDSLKDKFKLLLPPGYYANFIMPGDSQGEISITVPLGMNINKKGNSTKIFLYYGPVPESEREEMFYQTPHISNFENRLKYHYIIEEESYDKILEAIANGTSINLFTYYDVRNEWKFYILPVLALIILSLPVLIRWTFDNWYYFVVILLSFSTLYLTLRKERYQIPFNKFVFASIIVSVPLLIFKNFLFSIIYTLFVMFWIKLKIIVLIYLFFLVYSLT